MPVETLVDRAVAYTKNYQEELTAIVADEVYTQDVRAQVPLDRGLPRKSTLKSEIFFMFTPGADWMAIRDVATINNRPAADRPDLRSALQTLAAPAVARKFKSFNAQYNLGRVVRNFNEPTFSLLVLDQKYRSRFTFERRREQRVEEETLVTIGFTETKPPTLVRDLYGGPVFSSGEMTIEPASGRVTRVLMTLTIGTVHMALSTMYARDARLDIWVPSRFSERYEDGVKNAPRTVDGPARYEEIVCEARYANFRRFEVKSRIR